MCSTPRSSAGSTATASGRALGEQVHALDADRSKLAADLDGQLARSRQLETANRDIARRIDAAMENVRLVLEVEGPM